MIDLANPLTLVQHVLNNEAATAMTSGALVLGAVGWLGYQLRALPGQVIGLIEAQFTTSLIVQGDDAPFHRLTEWLAKHPWTRKSRRLAVLTTWDAKNERNRYEMTPGPGRHVLREDGRWYLVSREQRQQGQTNGSGGGPSNAPQAGNGIGGMFGRQESITISVFGRSHAPLKSLLEKLDRLENEKRDHIPVRSFSGRETVRTKRPLDTIYIEDAIKADVMADVHAFLARRAWCAERGVPWRRGYLLNGPPGTGKTSLIFAIASAIDAPVYTVNPSTIWDDDRLLDALNYPGPGSLVVIEDIDSVEVLKARPDLKRVMAQANRAARFASSAPDECAAVEPRVTSRDPPPQPNQRGGITLSGFLNAIDGIAGSEGRLLFVTTNCPDDLDPALTRPGRIDRVFHLGPAHAAQARAMFARFFPEADADAFVRMIGPQLPMAQAQLQNLMLALAERADPVSALHEEIARRFAA